MRKHPITCIQADCSEPLCTCGVCYEEENGENPFSGIASTTQTNVLEEVTQEEPFCGTNWLLMFLSNYFC